MVTMGVKRSIGKLLNLEIHKVFVVFIFLYSARFSLCITNPYDVAAINSLYTSLGSPSLPGWVASGGDPCGEGWQGVMCNGSDIVSIILNAVNLGGELGNNLDLFNSIRSIDLSNNRIEGIIPSNLPITLQNLFLSANNLTGSIPDSIASLTLLSDMSLNNNLLTGDIPDAFISLTGLINLDLSNNNLIGQLPPSLQNLAQLTSLHLQDNQLSGTLDVLQDLPLRDLNIENNQFSGPIPAKMLSIPNFRKDGNLFTTAAPAPAPVSPETPPPAPLHFGLPPPPTPPSSPSSGTTPKERAQGPSPTDESDAGGNKFFTTKKVVLVSIIGIVLLVILSIALLLFLPRCCRRREEAEVVSKMHQVGENNKREDPKGRGSLVQATNQTEKVPKETQERPKKEHVKPQNPNVTNVPKLDLVSKGADYTIDMSRLDSDFLPSPSPLVPHPPPTPPPVVTAPRPLPVEKMIVTPKEHAGVSKVKPSTKPQSHVASARSFTVATLQQYTYSFSRENLIGGGMLGNVYRAELPNGKLLAVKKLDKRASSQQNDEEFIDLVNNIDRIHHANVVELKGYCAEFGQRLLIYEYCRNGTLHDALHSEDDELRKRLPWNSRIRMALGAARALEYLHEVCHPPIVHRNFKSINILLDDENVSVSDCGLAPLISSGSVSKLSGQLLTAYGYGAPEFESGIYTAKSDVYSFGVVMLELLTGRKSYDRARSRGEQFLVRWAIPQLHDIDALSRMVDPSLRGQYSAKSLSHFADIISRCVQSEPEFRPPMSEVVQDLTDMMRRDRPSSESIGD